VYEGRAKPYVKPITGMIESSKYKVGDYVRVSKFKKLFEKGYTPKWSMEVFKVIGVDNSVSPILYALEDLDGEEVTGKFYEQEMQKTDLKDFSVVEKILQEKKVKGKMMYLVKYSGYPEKFNSWLTAEQLERFI